MVSRWAKDEFSFFKYIVCHPFFITLKFSSLKSVLRKMKMCPVMPQWQKLWEWCRKRSGPLPWDPSWGGGAWGLPSLEVSPWSICWKEVLLATDAIYEIWRITGKIPSPPYELRLCWPNSCQVYPSWKQGHRTYKKKPSGQKVKEPFFYLLRINFLR